MNSVERSITRVCKVVCPTSIDPMAGQEILQTMSEVACITATRFARRKVYMVSVEGIDFHKSIPVETIIEVIGQVANTGVIGIQIRVQVYKEQMYGDERELAVSGTFTIVEKSEERPSSLVDENNTSTQEEFIGGETELRKALNQRLSPKTIARATLYKYLQVLEIRKSLYTKGDSDRVIEYMKSHKATRKLKGKH